MDFQGTFWLEGLREALRRWRPVFGAAWSTWATQMKLLMRRAGCHTLQQLPPGSCAELQRPWRKEAKIILRNLSSYFCLKALTGFQWVCCDTLTVWRLPMFNRTSTTATAASISRSAEQTRGGTISAHMSGSCNELWWVAHFVVIVIVIVDIVLVTSILDP